MPWIKGESGNPKGKPKGTYSTLNLTVLLKKKLEECPKGDKKTYGELFISKLLHKALVEGDVQSLKIIINYVDGLPKQTIDTNLSGSLDLALEKMKELDDGTLLELAHGYIAKTSPSGTGEAGTGASPPA